MDEDIKKLVALLDMVQKESSTFIHLRELNELCLEKINSNRNALWLFFILNELIENFFYSLEGIDVSKNPTLGRELENFRKLFGMLISPLENNDVVGETKATNDIVKSYIRILSML